MWHHSGAVLYFLAYSDALQVAPRIFLAFHEWLHYTKVASSTAEHHSSTVAPQYSNNNRSTTVSVLVPAPVLYWCRSIVVLVLLCYCAAALAILTYIIH